VQEQWWQELRPRTLTVLQVAFGPQALTEQATWAEHFAENPGVRPSSARELILVVGWDGRPLSPRVVQRLLV